MTILLCVSLLPYVHVESRTLKRQSCRRNKRVLTGCSCPCANCACQGNSGGGRIMFLGVLLPFRQWLATGQATHTRYGNEGLWFIHSWFSPRPVCLLLNYVRIELPSSIQDCCGVLGQLCWQLATFVSSCIDGDSFSLRLSFTVGDWPDFRLTAVGNETCFPASASISSLGAPLQ